MSGEPGDPPVIRRGSIWWVAFDPAIGSEIRKTRPAVVLSANGLNRTRKSVTVVALSTGPSPRPPLIVSVPSAGGRSVAVCDQIRAVDKSRLQRPDGRLSPSDLREIENGVRAVLGLS